MSPPSTPIDDMPPTVVPEPMTEPESMRKRKRSDSDDLQRDHHPQPFSSKTSTAAVLCHGDTVLPGTTVCSEPSSSTTTMTMPSASSSKASTPTAAEEEEESSGSSSSKRSSTSIIRDEDYYFEDGSCILLVQDTLFNVHRSMLSRDHSSFGAMFSLPQGGLEAEGKSDDNPIVLPGDKASEFRHFLWALYALPHELRIINSPGADLTLLIDIARISNKYSFKSLETWALDAVHEYVNRKPSPLFFTSIDTYSSSLTDRSSTSTSTSSSSSSSSSPSSTLSIESTESLTRLIQLAQLCNHERLLNTMINLLRQLMSKSLQYAYLAMKLADDLDIRALRGSAYLEVMQKSVVVRKPTPGPSPSSTSSTTTSEEAEESSIAKEREVTLKEGSIDPQGRLVISPSQRLRLLSGYWNLTRQWEKLRTHPPVFAHSSSCGASWHHHGCTQSWVEFWKEKTKGEGVLEMGLADVLGRLRKVQKDYEKWGSATYMHHDCRLAARRCIGELVRGVEEKLPDYFGDEEGEEDYGVM